MSKTIVILAIFVSALLLVGCSHSGKQGEGVSLSDSLVVNNVADSVAVDSVNEEEHDWAPEEFKQQHPEEWAVVNKAINIQQREERTDFAEINTLVNSYIKRKGIALPESAKERIAKIEAICKKNFDITGYDDTNFGMHIADGTRSLFEQYVNWLYEQEAHKMLSKDVLADIEKDVSLMEALNKAMYDVCDSVELCFEGSGYWMSASKVLDIKDEFNRDSYKSIVGAKIEKRKTMDVSLADFDKECALLIDNYEPFDETRLQDATPVVNRFKTAFHNWYTHRKTTAKRLEDTRLRNEYETITGIYARIHFLHLKNHFEEIARW